MKGEYESDIQSDESLMIELSYALSYGSIMDQLKKTENLCRNMLAPSVGEN